MPLKGGPLDCWTGAEQEATRGPRSAGVCRRSHPGRLCRFVIPIYKQLQKSLKVGLDKLNEHIYVYIYTCEGMYIYTHVCV